MSWKTTPQELVRLGILKPEQAFKQGLLKIEDLMPPEPKPVRARRYRGDRSDISRSGASMGFLISLGFLLGFFFGFWLCVIWR